ncbi:VENN motif pre-toxin domain-containing protein [Neisseria arctica]|uniref:VENN motif pre-toxin domain-containing protein n=1 Tax=Neisseria arctica TaxID=1470200 RepID=UPI001FD3BE56|nr:VENN motif pre-toxin domain-containing protein [Neisseria arctica]UOO87154.1 VENN motif pre-toxin domain-containing protein [Neisseria arctica]
MGATLAYINGSSPASGGSAAVAAEKAAQYLAQQYDDGQTARDPVTGEFNANLLPEHIKDEIKAATGAIAAVVGATGDGGSALGAQIGGVIGQNAVENNTAGRRFRAPQLVRNDSNIAANNLQLAQVRSFIPNFNGFPTYRNIDAEGRGVITAAEIAQMRAFAEFLRTQPRGRSQAEYVARFNNNYQAYQTPTAVTQRALNIREYLNDIQAQTGYRIEFSQRAGLTEYIRANGTARPSQQELAKRRAEFGRNKAKLIREWEQNTGQKWPTYTKPVNSSKTGLRIRNIGDKYDVHHIQPLENNGANIWQNITPARYPDQHQGGIHRSGGPLRSLQKD